MGRLGWGDLVDVTVASGVWFDTASLLEEVVLVGRWLDRFLSLNTTKVNLSLRDTLKKG